jgi:hypothetical protein
MKGTSAVVPVPKHHIMSVYRRVEVKCHTLTSVRDGNEAQAGHSDYWEELLASSDMRLRRPQEAVWMQ